MLLKLLLIGILATITFHDFRNRSVPLVLLLITLTLAFLHLLLSNSVKTGLLYAGINLSGCALMLGTAMVLLFVLKRKLFNPVDHYLGSGDLLFFPVICFSFSPVNFLFFFIVSLALALLAKPIFFRKSDTFPLAGGQAFFLLLLIVLSVTTKLDMFNDSFLLSHLLY